MSDPLPRGQPASSRDRAVKRRKCESSSSQERDVKKDRADPKYHGMDPRRSAYTRLGARIGTEITLFGIKPIAE